MFSVDVAERGPAAVLTVRGELDLATAPQLRQATLAAHARGLHEVVLDLRWVDFIDSIGLGVVLGAHTRARAHGGRVVVVVEEPRVRQLFALSGLDQLIEVAPDLPLARG